jgi:hypothetical protein
MDVPRMLAVIVHLRELFLQRNRSPSRREKDSKDTNPFWHAAAVLFNNLKFKCSLEICSSHGLSLRDLSATYSGHVTTANELETLRFNGLRKAYDVATADFMASGGGDGRVGVREPVEECDRYVHSANFWNFCNGNSILYYFYLVLSKHDLLASAASKMSDADSFSSDDAGSSTRRKRTSNQGAAGMDGLITINRSENEVALTTAKKQKAEEQAKVAPIVAKAKKASAVVELDNAGVELMNKLQEATADLNSYESSSDFVGGSFLHKMKKNRISGIEAQLAEIFPDI